MAARIQVPSTEFGLDGGLGAVWFVDRISDNYSTLRRIDPATNQVTASYLLDSSAGGIAVGEGGIWVTMYYDNTVERIDQHGRVIARIPVGLQPQEVHVAFGSVWVSNHHGRSISRIDPRTDRVIATLPAGDQHMFRNGPQNLADDGRYLYLYSSNGDRPFERIDPRTNFVRRRRGGCSRSSRLHRCQTRRHRPGDLYQTGIGATRRQRRSASADDRHARSTDSARPRDLA